MKPLSETSLQVVENTLNSSSAQTTPASTSAHGSTQPGGKQITAYQPPRRPTHDEAVRAVSKLRTISLWQIKPTDTSEREEAVKVLAWALIPATYEEAMIPLTRLMSHFPVFDAQQKAVVLGDVCAEVVERGISLCTVVSVCREAWIDNTDDEPGEKRKPFVPRSGQLIKDMTERMKTWQGYYDHLLNPKPQLAAPAPKPPEPPRYGAEHWNDMDQENRARLMIDLKEYAPFLRNMLCRSYQVPEGFYDEYWAKFEEAQP